MTRLGWVNVEAAFGPFDRQRSDPVGDYHPYSRNVRTVHVHCTVASVVEIIMSATRIHLGLLMDSDGECAYMRAWSHFARLRNAGALADIELNSVKLSGEDAAGFSTVALWPASHHEYIEACTCRLIGKKPRPQEQASTSFNPEDKGRIHIARPHQVAPRHGARCSGHAYLVPHDHLLRGLPGRRLKER